MMSSPKWEGLWPLPPPRILMREGRWNLPNCSGLVLAVSAWKCLARWIALNVVGVSSAYANVCDGVAYLPFAESPLLTELHNPVSISCIDSAGI